VLTHTREHWGEARGKTFFITGGTGFFGMWLLESFTHINDALELGMSATVLTRDPKAFAEKAPHLTSRQDLRFIRGDIQTFDFSPGKFEYMVHAATSSSAKLNNENPLLMYDTITLGTRRVLQFAEQCGVEKLVLTSSGAVYGKQPAHITHIPESSLSGPDQLNSASAYAEGKRAAEHMCVLHARRQKYECKVARCFAFVGPHLPLDAHFAIGNFIYDVVNNRDIQINGDGSALRSYMYASDLVAWLWSILFVGKDSVAYNVGSEAAVSICQVAEAVKSASGAAHCSIKVSHPPKDGSPERYVPSTRLAYNELGLINSVSLDNSIQKTIAWLAIMKQRIE
jgi:nucleoside-diphosphate-sugar epimerase